MLYVSLPATLSLEALQEVSTWGPLQVSPYLYLALCIPRDVMNFVSLWTCQSLVWVMFTWLLIGSELKKKNKSFCGNCSELWTGQLKISLGKVVEELGPISVLSRAAALTVI